MLFFKLLLCAMCAQANMQLRSDVAAEIRGMKATTDRIVATTLGTTDRTVSDHLYDDLGNFTDWVGPRLSGSPELEAALDDQLAVWQADGIADLVYKEGPLNVPNWVRGQNPDNPTQDAFITFPLMGGKQHKMNILSGGQSNGTYGVNNGGNLGDAIEGDVIVVETQCGRDDRCAELDDLCAAPAGFCTGKIVVWYQYCGPKWRGYNSALRVNGARYAAQNGMIASLSCSNTAYGVDTPHTGTTQTSTVPAAALTVEDTELLDRISKRGQVPRVSLAMDCEVRAETPSYNIIAEYTGATLPDEYVIVGGHFDSWDVGTGAMDDMGGVYIGYQAIRAFKSLGLRPKRTIRVVGWTAEEVNRPDPLPSYAGAAEHFRLHRNESENVMIAMESDGGLFRPRGLGAFTSDGGRWVVQYGRAAALS
jgi:carboxypeptidase Q